MGIVEMFRRAKLLPGAGTFGVWIDPLCNQE